MKRLNAVEFQYLFLRSSPAQHFIENTTFIDELKIYGSQQLDFSDCIFTKKVIIDDKIGSRLSFFHCYFLGGIELGKIEIENELHFSDCKIRNFITVLSRTKIEKFSIYSSTIDEFLMYNGGNIGYLNIGDDRGIKINHININLQGVVKNIIFRGLEADRISLSNRNIENVEFSYSKCRALYISGFTRTLLKFYDYSALNKESSISIYACNLGKSEFHSFNFAEFSKIQISDSILTDCLFVGTTWTKNLVTRSKISSESSRFLINFRNRNEIQDLRELYRQIKYSLSKQGDIVNEQLFHGWEMNTYNQLLKWRPKTFSTKLILLFSSITSNYGQSLFRPILWLIITNGFLITWYNNFIFYPLDDISIEVIFENIAAFLWYSNPLRRYDLSFISYSKEIILDGLMRINSSYAIYNIIRASRRFLK